MKNNLLITVVLAVLVGAGAFFAGMQYQKSQVTGFAQGGQFRSGMTGQGQLGQSSQGRRVFQNNGSRPVNGEIISADSKSVTVKLTDGSTKIIILSSTTAINKASQVNPSDLKTGERIVVFGTENSDGSVTAQNISIGNTLFSGGPAR